MTSARDIDFSEFKFTDVINFYNDLRGTLYQELNESYPAFHCSRISSTDAIAADKWRHI